jgi:hypothetical protein
MSGDQLSVFCFSHSGTLRWQRGVGVDANSPLTIVPFGDALVLTVWRYREGVTSHYLTLQISAAGEVDWARRWLQPAVVLAGRSDGVVLGGAIGDSYRFIHLSPAGEVVTQRAYAGLGSIRTAQALAEDHLFLDTNVGSDRQWLLLDPDLLLNGGAPCSGHIGDPNYGVDQTITSQPLVDPGSALQVEMTPLDYEPSAFSLDVQPLAVPLQTVAVDGTILERRQCP